MPQRIQRQRTKDWRMPENTVYVGRPSEFGNPFAIGTWFGYVDGMLQTADYQKDETWRQCTSFQHAVDLYSQMMLPYRHRPPHNSLDEFFLSNCNYEHILSLKGKNLACWCPLNRPCHADILLEIANG